MLGVTGKRTHRGPAPGKIDGSRNAQVAAAKQPEINKWLFPNQLGDYKKPDKDGS
jgi:hypothetical protein